jgi:hypothetical protein
MKYTYLVLMILLKTSLVQSQTYYNPSQNINIVFTFREPFKPIDYSQIGKDFNNILQNEIAKREKLKQYYDQILGETISSIYSNTVLTNNSTINQKIILLQTKIVSHLEMLNRLLKNGTLKPNEYESNLRGSYLSYMNGNRTFLNITQYNFYKESEIKEETNKKNYTDIFNATINRITDFQFDYSNFEFIYKDNFISKTKPSSDLFQFVKESCSVGL